jgi:hypothetical protein
LTRGETHEIRNTGLTLLRTLNAYSPRAYTKASNPLPAGNAIIAVSVAGAGSTNYITRMCCRGGQYGLALDNVNQAWQSSSVTTKPATGSNQDIVYEGMHCILTIRRPALGVVLAIFKGPDVGEFGDKPFQELAKDLALGLPLELFIDASECLGPTVNVSNDWAHWMITNRVQLHRINLLSGTRYVDVTANFVRRFTEFGERMRIYTEREAFYEALTTDIGERTKRRTAVF